MQKNVEKMSKNYSPNFNLRKRSISKVKYLIFHYTGMKSENEAIKRLTNNNSGVSCHYFIKTNGKVIQIVPDLYIAWHAGISSWKKDKFLKKDWPALILKADRLKINLVELINKEKNG